MIALRWTERALDDLAAIHAFIESDSPSFAPVITRRLIEAVDHLRDFPRAGRTVPEWPDPSIREVVRPPYRVVYRIVSPDEIHVLTVHHGARGMVEVD